MTNKLDSTAGIDPRKKHFRITMLLLLCIAVMIGILGKGLFLNPNKTANALLGKVAKDFKVVRLQNEGAMTDRERHFINLADFSGSPVILNFWASWCVSCRQEAAIMEDFWLKNKDSGLKMIGIAIQDSPETALQFAKYFGKTYILGLDEDGKAGIDYGVTGVPETFFIDSQGLIVHKEAGPVSEQLMQAMYEKMRLGSKTI